MFIELLQLWGLVSGTFHYLVVHFFAFVVFSLIVRHMYARGYAPFTGRSSSNPHRHLRVSVVIPEYNEDLEILERTLESVAENRPDEVIVVHDDGRTEVRELASKYGAKVISLPERVGKRRALVHGWQVASGDIIVHVDSDVMLHKSAIDEIIKPFESDPKIVGVQGRNLVYRRKSWFAWRLSELIEANRDWNNKALNGRLVVVDGRFNAWRRDWLLKHVDQFLNERFLGRLCEIGDDRFLTWLANLEGFRTVYQATAVAETASPRTYVDYIKQQLRWARSGYKFFFKDFISGLVKRVPWQYVLFQVSYYLGPLSFTVAILYDTLFAPPLLSIPLWSIVPLAVIGSGLIALMRRLAVGLTKMTITEFLLLGATSLFIHYPLMLYALATMMKQGSWLTR